MERTVAGLSTVDIIQFLILGAFLIYGVLLGLWEKAINSEQDSLWEAVKKHIILRKKLYEELADPEKIEREMEAGARLREMHDAKRTTLPREDAGPPAVIHNPSAIRAVVRGKKAKP